MGVMFLNVSSNLHFVISRLKIKRNSTCLHGDNRVKMYKTRFTSHKEFSMRIISVVAVSLMIGASGAYAVSAADSSPVTRGELGGLVSDYLKKNPEVIIDAVAEYQKNTQAVNAKESAKLVAANKDAIYNNPAMPSIGAKDAKVTIVEFFDYNCSACKYMFKTIDNVLKGKPEDVRVIFMEFPIFGEQSEKLAKIGLAVHALSPKKYYEFHGHMMSHKGTISADNAYAYAEKVGLKRDVLEKELSNPKYEKLREDNVELGKKLKITGTPFLVIGEEVVPHALDDAGMKDYLAKARAK
jgi:protein-disulfide isomerase